MTKEENVSITKTKTKRAPCKPKATKPTKAKAPKPATTKTPENNTSDTENTLLLTLKDGDVVIKMFPEVAPNHVARIKELVKSGYYDGLKFHRVIDGFMAQTGCPNGTGMGGSGKKLKAEFNSTPHKKGTLSMARSSDINSADSQFFICFDNCSWLDNQYTVWGEVVSGIEHVDTIKKGAGRNGEVSQPDLIISLKVIADI